MCVPKTAALRHQLTVLRRKVRGRIQFTNGDRLFLSQLYRWFPSVLTAIAIILDNWDPALLDTLALEREVIAFNNVTISASSRSAGVTL